MKKSVIVGLSITIIGGILMAIALGHTGFKTIVWDNGFRVEDEQAQATKMNVKELGGSVNKIKFATESQVIIRTRNVKKLSISYSKNNHVKQDGSALTITGKRQHQQHHTRIIGFSIESYDNDDGHVLITIPKKTKLKEISGRSDDSVSISNLDANNIELTGEADINMAHVKTLSTLNLKGTDDTTLKNVTAPDVTQTSDGGDLTYQNADFSSGSSTVSTDGGDIDALISNPKKGQVSANTDGGDVSLFGHSRSSWQMAQKKSILYRLTSDGGDITVR